MNNLFDQLLESCTHFPTNDFCSDNSGKKYKYYEFLQIVKKRNLFLKSFGIKKGDIIFIASTDPISILELMFSSWSLGCVVSIINPLTKESDVNKLINLTQPALSYVNGVFEFLEFKNDRINIVPPEACIISFTTGTSNKPKGVIHSHKGILSNATLIGQYLGLTINDRCLNLKSLNHVAALSSLVVPAILVGAQIFCLKESSILDWGKYLYEYKITYIDVVVTVLKYIALFVKSHNDHCPLRVISVNGEHLSTIEWERLKKVFPDTDIYYSYGLSEAGPRVTFISPQSFTVKKGSVGKALDGIDIKIQEFADTYSCHPTVQHYQDSRTLIGEISVKSPSLMIEYFCDDDLTIKTIIDGYLLTGDVGYLDPKGYLYVLGRKDSVINRGGQNIYPYEVEDLIKKMPPIKECIVEGIPDSHYGNSIIAAISLDSNVSKEDILNYCAEQLPNYLVPSDIVFLENFPESNGKILRNEVKKLLIEMYDSI